MLRRLDRDLPDRQAVWDAAPWVLDKILPRAESGLPATRWNQGRDRASCAPTLTTGADSAIR